MTKTEIFIKKAIEKHGNKYDYSKVEYIHSKAKVTIICPIHGEFHQRPAGHLIGGNCKLCSITSTAKTTYSFIEKSISIHGDKYDYSKVKYVNNAIKVIIICPIHGEFQQQPNVHTNGGGCQKCSRDKVTNHNKSTTKSFIYKSKIAHGNRYDYSKVEYVHSKTKVTIICDIHGEFQQTPYRHLQGSGCRACGYDDRIAVGYADKTDCELKNIDGYFYDIVLHNTETKETFSKFGITKNFKQRFTRYAPYKLKYIIELKEMSIYDALIMEKSSLKYAHKYIPNLNFSGSTECYK